MTRRRPDIQWWWLIWAGAGICVFLCGALLGAASGGGSGQSHGFLQLLAPAFGGRDRVTILAVGVDNSEGRGLADTIIVLAVWPKTGEVGALSIPRDSRVVIPGVGTRRINESHAYGRLPLTIETVEWLLGSPLDYCIEVSVPGLVKLVDAIGGIDIEVEKRMYYRDRSQDLLIDLQPGLQHLNGEQAVGYVRFRHDATGDLGRIERQRTFLRSVAREMLSPERVSRLPKLADAFVETVETNLTIRDILSLKKIVEQAGPDAIRMATLPSHPRMIGGQSVLELDAEEVQQAVDRVLWGQGIRVVILNGTDVGGLAAQTAGSLEEHGCEVLDVGNAERKSATTLILDHRGQTRRAEQVSSMLGGGVISAAPDGDNPADVTIILGDDFGRAGR
ncbi:MAG TPA: LCP family protein [Armatimonadota bacterium]|nr:LCP family protein [Armatimonadota bacterium]